MTREQWLDLSIRWRLLDVRHELSRRAHPGGQQVTPGALSGCSVSALRELERGLRSALETDCEWFGEIDYDSERAAIEDHRSAIL